MECRYGHLVSGLNGTAKTDEQTVGAQLYAMFMPAAVSKRDYAKYVRYCSNWTYLAAHLAIGVSIQELGMLLYIELHGRNRPNMVNRLVGALGARMRDEFRGEVGLRHPSGPKE